jgi:hypothetical protein
VEFQVNCCTIAVHRQPSLRQTKQIHKRRRVESNPRRPRYRKPATTPAVTHFEPSALSPSGVRAFAAAFEAFTAFARLSSAVMVFSLALPPRRPNSDRLRVSESPVDRIGYYPCVSDRLAVLIY